MTSISNAFCFQRDLNYRIINQERSLSKMIWNMFNLGEKMKMMEKVMVLMINDTATTIIAIIMKLMMKTIKIMKIIAIMIIPII